MRPWRNKPHRRHIRKVVRRPHCNRARAGGSLISPDSNSSIDEYQAGRKFLDDSLPFFGNRLSPDGGPTSFISGERMRGKREKEEQLKLPETSYGSRPPLSNIFPMISNSSESIPSSTPTHVSPRFPPSAYPSRPMDQWQRRHSTPVTPSTAPSTPGDRRPSASSDISSEKFRKDRRERRASVTRDIPLLPRRNQDPFQRSIQSSPDPSVSPYSEYNGPSPVHSKLLIDSSNPRQIVITMGPTMQARPPVAPGGLQNVGSFPPMYMPPHKQLRELQEELEEDREADGAENELAMIDEADEIDYHQPIGSESPLQKDIIAGGGGKNKEAKSEGGLGFGIMQGLRFSKRSKELDMKNKARNRIPPELKDLKKEEEPEVKGFDGFFMY